MSAALHLIETLAECERATLSELSRRAGFTHNQTFRLLATFEDAGYVVRGPDKAYRLGAKLHLLGRQAAWPHELIESSAAALDELAELSGETALLSVPAETDRMIVDARASRYSLRVMYSIGSRLPLYVGGMGVAMLAFSPPELQAQMLGAPRRAYTPQTLVDTAALQAELASVRHGGVRISRDDYALGEFSVAAPIIGGNGWACGALNIAGFTARLDSDTERRYIVAVKEAAQKVTAALSRITPLP
ncbi:IclR family transcriptional regulator [Deinococcus frigens]|uniref:IclR family transcriptional regulator n=1 Tax=Deinococcus frigens TaxID=249403 RepID=UPI00049792A5|nr:IclR family transcriptional regulator [Deinococcus frigens]